MIKNFKIFEFVNESPKVGDYVIITTNYLPRIFKNYFDNNAGLIKDINKNHLPYDYKILFQNIPDELINNHMFNIWYDFPEGSYPKISNSDFSVELRINNILYWSNNKEELEKFIIMKKYNL